jgi:hypothetical protein
MLRILRAFVWLRWRMLLNSLENTGARDRLERFSLAIERLGPIMAAVFLIPSMLGLAIVASAAGYSLGRGDQHSLLFEALRYLLLFIPIASIVGPLFLPAADRTNPVRLLLLPIPRRTLYAAQAATALGDVWTVIVLPIALFVPFGLALAGALDSAVVVLAGGAVFLAVVIGLSALATSVLHLIARDRRRGELLALLFILIIPAVSMLPGLLHGRHSRGAQRRGSATEEVHLPVWVAAAAGTRLRRLPERVVRAVRAGDAGARGANRGDPARTAGDHRGSRCMRPVCSCSDESRFAGRDRRAPIRHRAQSVGDDDTGTHAGCVRRGAGAAAARPQTPRGRSILLSPLVMMAVFAVVVLRRRRQLRSRAGVAQRRARLRVVHVVHLPRRARCRSW